MKYFIGIDPGANGCMCILRPGKPPTFIDFKTSGLKHYAKALRELKPELVALEKVASMPGQGVRSVFSFGQRLGELEGMLQTLDIGYEQPRPLAWQKACGVKPKSGKKGVHQAVSRLYPTAELLGPKGGILDGRCDALGIAHYLRLRYKEDTC